MINLKQYQNKIDDLKNIHAYIKKKLIGLYILFALIQILFISSFVIMYGIMQIEPKIVSIIFLIVSYVLSFLLFIPISKYQSRFTQGDLREVFFDILNKETGLFFEPIPDLKEFKNFVKTNSNIIESNSITPYLYINIYDENHEKIIGTYSYINITYNENLTYYGYLIMIPSCHAKGDIKIFTKKFELYGLNYKKDKENSDYISNVFYNKKEEYIKDVELINLHKEIDNYYNEYLSNKMSIGLLSKNKYLSIMFANNPKCHPNFGFKHRLTDEYLEALINSILKDVILIKDIYNR